MRVDQTDLKVLVDVPGLEGGAEEGGGQASQHSAGQQHQEVAPDLTENSPAIVQHRGQWYILHCKGCPQKIYNYTITYSCELDKDFHGVSEFFANFWGES